MLQFEIIKFKPKELEKKEDGIGLNVYSNNNNWNDFIYNLEPTKTIYQYKFNGELHCCIFIMYYKNLDKSKLEKYNVIMLTEDFNEEA